MHPVSLQRKDIPMKTLYIHIGMPKTGTSSIQRFLLGNETVLNEYGYCFPHFPYKYPYVYDNRNGYFLIGKCYDEEGIRDLKLERKRLKDGLTHICRCFKTYENVILTEETLWRCLYTRKLVAPTIKTHVETHGYQVKIIVYLRRQDEFQISIWKQNVKHAKTAMTMSFEERLTEVLENESYLFEYGSRLDDLAAVFGAENLIVRRFEPDSWKNGSLIDDFLDCIGLEHTEDFHDLPSEANPSLSENMAYMKGIINKSTTFSKQEISYLGQIMRDLSGESSAAYPCSMMSAEEANTLLERFADENEHAAKTYCRDDRPLFSDRMKDVPKWQPDNPHMQEDMIRFFSTAIIDLRRENRILFEELKTLSEEQKTLCEELNQLQKTVANEQKLFRMFKMKLKHPLRTLKDRLKSAMHLF